MDMMRCGDWCASMMLRGAESGAERACWMTGASRFSILAITLVTTLVSTASILDSIFDSSSCATSPSAMFPSTDSSFEEMVTWLLASVVIFWSKSLRSLLNF